MVSVIVAAVSGLCALVCVVLAYVVRRDDVETAGTDGGLAARVDRLFPYVGLGVAALLFATVAAMSVFGP